MKLTAKTSIIAAVLTATAVTSCSNKQQTALETAAVFSGSIKETVTATGTLESVTQVDVGTQVTGEVAKLYADYNSIVKKGDLIAEIDKTLLESEVDAANANMESARATFEYKKTNYLRDKELHDKKLISDYEFETSENEYTVAKLNYEKSKADRVKATENLGYAEIYAPIDGIIISREVEIGQTVVANMEVANIFTIADLDNMQVIGDVDEADIGQVKVGQNVTFTVDAYPNDVFEGTVMQIRLGDSESTSSSSSTSTSTVVTYEVVISADNPDLKLKPRLTANVTIFTLERDNVLTVPTKSLRFVPDVQMLTQLGYIVSEAGKEAPAGKRLVWIKNGQELKPKAVTVGSTSGNMIEITDGLNEGEELAVDLEASSITPAAEAETERSPFMPGPPGSNKNKKSAK